MAAPGGDRPRPRPHVPRRGRRHPRRPGGRDAGRDGHRPLVTRPVGRGRGHPGRAVAGDGPIDRAVQVDPGQGGGRGPRGSGVHHHPQRHRPVALRRAGAALLAARRLRHPVRGRADRRGRAAGGGEGAHPPDRRDAFRPGRGAQDLARDRGRGVFGRGAACAGCRSAGGRPRSDRVHRPPRRHQRHHRRAGHRRPAVAARGAGHLHPGGHGPTQAGGRHHGRWHSRGGGRWRLRPARPAGGSMRRWPMR